MVPSLAAMSVLEAIVLGVVQGVSEFLPISSSGHLVLTRWLLGWEDLSDETATAFDVAVHVGTLAGALLYLRHDVKRYATASLRPLLRRGALGADGRVGWSLMLSAVPAATIGVLLSEAVTQSRRVMTVALALVAFGLLMELADRFPQRRDASEFGYGHALVMGLGQALALQPGVSRSGVTMTVARLLGYERAAAVRIAFLMSLPVIAGAGLYGLVGLSIPGDLWPALTCGVAASAITGWASVWIATKLVRRLGFRPFVVYRVTVGVAVLLLA